MKIKDLEIFRTAQFSPCLKWRYRLGRIWYPEKPTVMWICLNPSIADVNRDDPTVKRMMQFSLDWGFGAADIRNIFSYVATDPQDMYKAEDPIGPGNDLLPTLDTPLIMAGWGTHGEYMGRGQRVLDLLHAQGFMVHALEFTKDNYPRHPLYVSGDRTPMLMLKGVHF